MGKEEEVTDKLTRQEVEYLIGKFALLAARADWKPKSIDRINALGDLALQSLSQESVRSEARNAALEEAAKVCEKRAQALSEDPNNGYVEGDTNAFIWTNLAPESPAKEQPGEQRWIPKSERLPELGVDVLIYHVLGDTDRPEVPHAYDVGWLLKDGWYFPWDRGRDRQRPMFVTHWMPLPPPPPERP